MLITSYTTASARQCKCGCFSLPLYSKQERPLFTAALEQTSNVPTARDVGGSCVRVRRRASGLPYPASGRRSRLSPLPSPSVAFPPTVSTHAPRSRRPGRCLPLNAPIRRAPATKTNFYHMSLAHKRSSNLRYKVNLTSLMPTHCFKQCCSMSTAQNQQLPEKFITIQWYNT